MILRLPEHCGLMDPLGNRKGYAMPLYNSLGQMILPTTSNAGATPGAGYQVEAMDRLRQTGERPPFDLVNPRNADYQRYREMTVDQMLLENRVVFLVGEINHASSYNVIMRL